MGNNTFFKINEELILHDLSEKLGLSSPKFIIKEIIQGGMGTCAKIESIDKQVFALKIIHLSLLENKIALQRYLEEMKTWLTLSSCNGVVEALCITRVNDIPCIASKWMSKGSIRPYINQTNSDFFYKCIYQIASTLDWAFTKYSIIHRDLKPENILLDNDNNAYIADWGLARSIVKQTDEIESKHGLRKFSNKIELTDAGDFLGTILYASPEQILGEKNIDNRSDIYSLGCMMYEWETGTPPFMANTVQEIATQHLRLKPKQIGGLFKRSNFNVTKIIEKCLEKNPDNRFQTYSEFINALSKVSVRKSNFKKFIIEERYKTPLIGENELENKFREKPKKGLFSKKTGLGIVEFNEIAPFLKEAESLMSLGEYEKANKIYNRFYIFDTFKQLPDLPLHQNICINYALSLRYIGDNDKSIAVLRTLDNAKIKPASYYINLSLLYLLKRDYLTAEKLCSEGLKKYPNDNDLLGNLTIALTNQDKLEKALQTAIKGISITRNVNSLEEIASVLNRIGDSKKNNNFPKAIEDYKLALSYLKESILLNPNFETARISIANTLYKLKKYKESTNEATYVCNNTKNWPTLEIGLYYIARNLLWTSSYEEGKEFCDKWLKKYPNSILLKRILSQILVDGYVIGNYTKDKRVIERSSLEFFTSIVEDKRNRIPSDFFYLAKIYEWMGTDKDIKKAISLSTRALSIYPEYWKFDYAIASIYIKYNYPKNALDYATIAYDKAPWRESVYFLISIIYDAMGNKGKTEKYKKKGNEIYKSKQKLYIN